MHTLTNPKRTTLFAQIAVATSLCLLAQTGQAQTKPITKILKPVNIKADRVNVHPPIAFKAFPMVDPKTGKPIPPTSPITLPNGKQITAAQFYNQLNSLESGLNKIGYSLRQPKYTGVLQENILNYDLLDRQKATTLQVHKTIPAQSVTTYQAQLRGENAMRYLDDVNKLPPNTVYRGPILKSELAPIFNILQARYAGTVNLIPCGNATQFHATRTWNPSWGDPSTFAAYLNALMQVDATATDTRLHGEFSAGGSIFGDSFDAIDLAGTWEAPSSTPEQMTFDVNAFGNNVYHFAHSGPYWQADTLSQPWDVSTTAHFWIGPIPMSATIGAQGDLGIHYSVIAAKNASPNRCVANGLVVQGGLTPFIHSAVYAQAGVDLWLVSGGVGVSLTLLNDDLTLWGNASLLFDSSNSPYLHTAFSIYNTIDTLDGSLYFWAHVNYLFGSWDGRWDVWNWTGIQSDGYLVNETYDQPLFN